MAASTDPTSGGGKADGQEPTIKFASDWSETASGPLVAGGAVRIEYDLARATMCRGTTMGSEVWGVSGYASFNGGAPKTFGLSELSGGHVRPVSASIEIPSTATTVAFWFANNNRWGCISYDSNDGNNYTFDVSRPNRGAVLAFDADWTESQEGAIHAGDQITIHYEPSRLEQCAGSNAGHAAWSITGYYQVDGGPVKTLFVSRANGTMLVAADPTLTVPHGSDLALWFQATNLWGCNAYDSDMGGNYHFAIE